MRDQGFTIRPAEFKDAEDIFALIKSYPDELLPRPVPDIVQNIDRFIVCEKDGRIVGTVSWAILPEIGKPQHPSVEVKSLAVAAGLRRSGVGTALIRRVVRHIRTMHPAQIIALTFAPSFFARLGFREVPKEKLIHKIYAGCVNCSKYDNPFTCPEKAMSLDLA